MKIVEFRLKGIKMDEALLKFIQDNKPNRGILDKYADEIMAMREANLSFKLILEYLETRHDVKTSIQNVAQWYKRKTAKKTQRVTGENVKIVKEKTPVPNDEKEEYDMFENVKKNIASVKEIESRFKK
ncbi:MAG: hypothetical protein EOM55_05475 [Clostridia bacterium]|nr:hypothetical protein [Clostridia bacterium]